MQHTKNYHLPQWSEEDRIFMTDFNQMCADIEKGMTDNANALTDYKAVNSAALTQKADNTAVDALETRVTSAQNALQEAVNNRFAEVVKNLGATGKNTRIEWGSYTGSGIDENDRMMRLDTSFYPVFIVMRTADSNHVTFMLRGCSRALSDSGSGLTITWGDLGITWKGLGKVAADRNDAAGKEYFYVVFGYDKNAE